MIETRIDALDFLAQLDEEIVFDYEAVSKTIPQIVTDLLTYQENTIPITLGTIQPVVTRSIEVQQDTILGVLRGLRDTVGGYISVDTSRRLNWYTDIGENKGQQIRYKKNIKGLSRTREYSNFGNRLYCYGAGEGSARIHLSEAIGWIVDYVEDVPSQTLNGMCIKQLVDTSITDPDVLLAWANLQLAEMKNPRASYSVDMVNLAAMGWDFEALQLGSIVKVIDEDMGIDISARVVKITRDLTDPGNIKVEISNITMDILDTLHGVYDTQQFESHIATKIGAGQVVVLGEFVVSDWLTGGTTNIKGDYIRSGVIQSNNWGVGAGSYFDLVAGTFKLGGSAAPKLSWDGATLTITGAIYATSGEFTGTLKVTNIEAGKTLTVNGDLRSANYVANVSGWKIDGAGNAELNTALIRGTLYTASLAAGNTLTISGTVSAGAGAVLLSSTGLKIIGQYCTFYYGSTWIGSIYGDLGGLTISAQGNYPISLIGKVLWIPTAASDPSSPSEGYLYGNTTSHTLRYYNGAWKTVTLT